jgi:hypothetical protein
VAGEQEDQDDAQESHDERHGHPPLGRSHLALDGEHQAVGLLDPPQLADADAAASDDLRDAAVEPGLILASLVYLELVAALHDVDETRPLVGGGAEVNLSGSYGGDLSHVTSSC